MDEKPGLLKIKAHACPDCGCERITRECKEHKHTCGDWNEYRDWDCGYKLHYTPNFGRVEEVGECKFTKKYREKKAKQAEALAQLRQYLSTLDVDPEWKERISRFWPEHGFWA